MHGTYLFLVRTSEASQSIKEKAKEAVSYFEKYLNDHSDENNWSQVLGVVSRDNETINLCDDGDWRGRDKIMGEFCESPKSIWEKTIKFSIDIANSDVSDNLEDSNIEISLKKLIAKIKKIIKCRILPSWATSIYDTKMKSWYFGKIETHLKHLKSCKTGGFSLIADTPYSFRCYDLREGLEQSGDFRDVILLVDIHT